MIAPCRVPDTSRILRCVSFVASGMLRDNNHFPQGRDENVTTSATNGDGARSAHTFATCANVWGTLYNRVGVVKRHVDLRRVLTFLFVEGFGVALGVVLAFAHATKARF